MDNGGEKMGGSFYMVCNGGYVCFSTPFTMNNYESQNPTFPWARLCVE